MLFSGPVSNVALFGATGGSPFGRLHEPSSLVGRKDSTRSQADSIGWPLGCVRAPGLTQECYPLVNGTQLRRFQPTRSANPPPDLAPRSPASVGAALRAVAQAGSWVFFTEQLFGPSPLWIRMAWLGF